MIWTIQFAYNSLKAVAYSNQFKIHAQLNVYAKILFDSSIVKFGQIMRTLETSKLKPKGAAKPKGFNI